MSSEALEWWTRALTALATARGLVDRDSDASASRAYYAAFFAVSALFAAEGRSFRKHREVEVAVHRDVVKPGRWSTDVGAAYSWLSSLRQTGDYGGAQHVSADEAREAVVRAQRVLDAVRDARSELFPDRTAPDFRKPESD